MRAPPLGPVAVVSSTSGVPKPAVDAVDMGGHLDMAAAGPRTGTMADLFRREAAARAEAAQAAVVPGEDG